MSYERQKQLLDRMCREEIKYGRILTFFKINEGKQVDPEIFKEVVKQLQMATKTMEAFRLAYNEFLIESSK